MLNTASIPFLKILSNPPPTTSMEIITAVNYFLFPKMTTLVQDYCRMTLHLQDYFRILQYLQMKVLHNILFMCVRGAHLRFPIGLLNQNYVCISDIMSWIYLSSISLPRFIDIFCWLSWGMYRKTFILIKLPCYNQGLQSSTRWHRGPNKLWTPSP